MDILAKIFATQVLPSHSWAFLILLNLVLASVLVASFIASRKFVEIEFNKIKTPKINRFDKAIIIFAGVILSSICCVISLETVSFIIGYSIPEEFIAIMAMFIGVTICVKSLLIAHISLKKSKNTEQTLQNVYNKFRRVTCISFLIAIGGWTTLNIISQTQLKDFIILTISTIILVYYFLETYYARHIITNCFTVEKSSEYSLGAKLVDFINDKFIFLSLLGMIAVIVVNQREIINPEKLIFANIRDSFLAFLLMFGLQIITSTLVNRILIKLENLEYGKVTLKSAKARKDNLLWICDVLVVSIYLSVAVIILWYMGIDIKKYIFHDTFVTIILVCFITMLIYNAFKEFTDALIDKANHIEHERLLTFMPVVSIIFNIIIMGTSGTIILSKLGVEIIPLLASFTAVSAAIALSAQDIIKGFLQGIILLFENNFYVGDFITINGITGTVERISARTLLLRDTCGDIHVIPYDVVKTITNHSKDYFLHSEQLLLAPSTNIEKASQILMDIFQKLRQDSNFAEKILSDIKIHGVNAFAPDGIRITWSFRTTSDVPGRLVHLEIYKRLWEAFKKENIEVPYQQKISLLNK